MYNDAQLSVVGNVASDPEYKVVGNGIPLLKVRVAWTTRRRDPATGEWVDANSSFANVNCWRRLAVNLRGCLRKGDPVLLRGQMEVRQYTTKDGQPRQSVDVDAETLGHNLLRGVASFSKTVESAGKTAAELEAEAAAAAQAGDGGFSGDDAVPPPEVPDDGAGDDMFDDSAIDALAEEAEEAEEAGAVTTPV